MVAPPTNRDIRESLKFILDELVRHSALARDPAKYMQAVREDGWPCELSFPDGSNRLIGKKAYTRLSQLSLSVVETDYRLKGKIGSDVFFEVLSGALGTAIVERQDIRERDFIESCVQMAVAKHLKSVDFFIPCIAPSCRGMGKFHIGPVTFFEKRRFMAANYERIQVLPPFDLSRLEESYKLQNWIAHVRIEGFEETRAEERTYLCVRLAIASIKARLSSRSAQWLGTEKQPMPALTSYSLTSEPVEASQRIAMGWRTQFINVGYGTEVESLMSIRSRKWFAVLGDFLGNVSCLGEWSYLQSKIVTALIWLDIGNTPTSDAEKVVAFSNCLETMFVTRDQGKKRQLVSRSRLLLGYSGWCPDLNNKVENFYSSRGDVVHGDIMPLASELAGTAFVGKYLTDVCIEGFIHFSRWLLDKHSRAGTREHERPFNGRGSFDLAMEQELPLFIEEMRRRHAATGALASVSVGPNG